MTNNLLKIDEMKKEAHRIEEDSTLSSKGHWNAAARWSCRNHWIGIPATLIAAASGVSVLTIDPVYAAILAFAATVLSALATFLKPTEQSVAHNLAAGKYNALRNDARYFKNITLLDVDKLGESALKLEELCRIRTELNSSSPQIPAKDFEKARGGVADGEALHEADKGVKQ